MRKALVFFRDHRAGLLEETEQGFRFIYDSAYLEDPKARPISLSFPLRMEAYESASFFPFFDGMIPEGWYLEIVSKVLKIDEDDRFGLLLANGSHTIGAVSVVPWEAP